MDKVTVAKYAAAGVLLAGIAAFEWYGKAPAGTFVGLATAALTALGYHTAAGSKSNA